ncbi:MAG: biotin transporter BioY [Acidimicrobiales bacterium]
MAVAVPVARRPMVLTDLIPGALVRDLALVVGGAAFVGLVAQVSFKVPGSPVPITGQTFGVLLGSAALGWRRAVPSMALYLLAGMVGVPWFAGHASGTSLAALGYIIGFVLAGGVVGALANHGGDRTPLRTAGTMLLGTALIYLVGVPYLMIDLHLGLSAAVREGLRPFWVGDLLKVALAAGLLPSAWALVGHYEGRPRPAPLGN